MPDRARYQKDREYYKTHAKTERRREADRINKRRYAGERMLRTIEAADSIFLALHGVRQ